MKLITYDVPGAAELLHSCERMIYEYIYQKKLRAVKIAGKWIIKEEWIEEFIDALEVKEAI